MSNAVETVKSAASPTEALLALAEFIDQRLDEFVDKSSETDGWGAWSDTTNEPVNELPAANVEFIKLQIEELRSKLSGNEDVDESRAIAAKIMLLEDELQPAIERPDLDKSRTVQQISEDGDVAVDLPSATPEHEEWRREFARNTLQLESEYDNGDEIVESYAVAGPLLLYYTDRDFVMRMSPDARATMVQDVEEFSPNEAQEMARDILKDEDAGTPERALEDNARKPD